MCVCGALAFAACSTEEPVGNGKDTDVNLSDGYVSVSIGMPVATRADDDKYEYGTDEESKVNNVLFFFFDGNDVCIDIQRIENAEFIRENSQDPYIENIGTAELRLKTGFDYKKVAVVLNSSVEELAALQNDILNLDDLLARKDDYIDNITRRIGQPMSNSVYYEEKDAATLPSSTSKVILVPIEANNVYTAAEKAAAHGGLPEGKDAVEVFVERIAARIDVEKADFNMDNYYISEVDGVQKKTLTLYNDDLTTEEIIVKPVVKGMTLNVLVPEANLIKNMTVPTTWGYGIGEFGWKNFRWNDPVNKRSFWAVTNSIEKKDITYYSWADASACGNEEIKEYVHPNTMDNRPTLNAQGYYDNEKMSRNLKVMVTAELHKYGENGEDLGEIDIVRYGADYMLPNSLFAQAASSVNNAIRSIDWTAAGLVNGDEPLSEAQVEAVSAAVYNAFVGKTNDNEYFGVNAGELDLKIMPEGNTPQGQEDGQAIIVAGDNFKTYDIDLSSAVFDGLDKDALLAAIKTEIDKTVDDAMKTVNKVKIYFWKGGKTYYYISIRHQGFYGLTGNGTQDFLFGVVRNHIYKVKLNGIYGLGTPVIDPNKPIDPDRPEDTDPSFLQAKINILQWRIVPVNVTIH